MSAPSPALFYDKDGAPPKGVTESGVILVDLSKYSFNDIMADDNGSYKYEGSPAQAFYFCNNDCIKAHRADGKWIIKRRRGKKYVEETAPEGCVYILHRTYRRHKIETNFTNIACRLKLPHSNEFARYCLLINSWAAAQDEHQVFQKACHGNATRPLSMETPYMRTAPSVLNKMKDDIRAGSAPRDAYKNAIENSGGPYNSQSQSEEPRNPKQVCIEHFAFKIYHFSFLIVFKN